ncbi:aminotransferase class III [Candidatus Magnetomorum sp. HK-1]|nr:aminotransferase class III [Candidatus Magnetomorum sp. HK-1]
MSINNHNPLNAHFLTASPESRKSYDETIMAVAKMLTDNFAMTDQPYSGKTIPELKILLNDLWESNSTKQSLPELINEIGPKIVKHLINVNHPLCIAHLHCPPLISSIAAEIIISATNQSMDSWDQSGAATLIEQQMLDWLCQRYGFSKNADGIFTSGGTQSNFMGLLLARDYAAFHNYDWLISDHGLPSQANKFCILCSEDCHFSIHQSAHLLGFGKRAVFPIAANDRLSPMIVKKKFYELKNDGMIPIALVSTAGTTDTGSFAPIEELAVCSKELNLWFHVDAAFGGGVIFSDQHRNKLKGVEQADSISIDFHKLFYQSISCGVFLLKNKNYFDFIKLNVDYLNPESNEKYGISDLVGKSIQTTRRFDALKIYLALKAYGEEFFGILIDVTFELALTTASYIEKATDFELLITPVLNTVVFRYCPVPVPSGCHWENYYNKLNKHIRLALLQSGQAIIGCTKINGRVYLKLTLMNPLTRIDDIKKLFKMIRQEAKHINQRLINKEDRLLDN